MFCHYNGEESLLSLNAATPQSQNSHFKMRSCRERSSLFMQQSEIGHLLLLRSSNMPLEETLNHKTKTNKQKTNKQKTHKNTTNNYLCGVVCRHLTKEFLVDVSIESQMYWAFRGASHATYW